MIDVTRGTRGEIVIRIDGTFDPQAALRLSGRLDEVPVGSEVILDFSRARELQDLGLAAVAGPLAGHGPLHVFGLSHHQRRLLRYLGVDLGPPEELEHAGDDEVFG
jgi:hypothetical protein